MRYANWFQRAGAYVIDELIASVPFLICVFISRMFRDDLDNATSASMGVMGIGYALYLGVIIYNRWIMGGRTGQSWGRLALGITLVGEQSGEPIGPGTAFARDLCHLLDSLACYIGWLFPLWDKKRQTFADKIVKSVVVPEV